MPLVNLITQVDESIVAKAAPVTIKLANGQDVLVVNGTVNGHILALIQIWNLFHQDDTNHDHEGMAVGGLPRPLDKIDSNWQDLYIDLVQAKGVALLVELSEAAVRLELWPLFELCSKTLANKIKTMDNKQVSQLLGITNDETKGPKLSAPCIKGFLKYLSIEKRLELDSIELKEWQQASYSLWAVQKVLRFGGGQVDMVKCKHTTAGFDETSLVECTKRELDENRRSIQKTDERKCPDKFLAIVRKCTNLETISWDADFGQLADPEFAYVLKMNCPQLEHVQGVVRKKFPEYQICPASFIHLFKRDKNTTCYHVKYEEAVEAEKMATVATADESAQLPRRANQMLKDNGYVIKVSIGNPLVPGFMLKAHLSANVHKCTFFQTADIGTSMYIVSAQWYNEYFRYLARGSGKPGMVSNLPLIRSDSGRQSLIRPNLRINVDYVAMRKQCWDIVEVTFDADRVISRPVIANDQVLSLDLNDSLGRMFVDGRFN